MKFALGVFAGIMIGVIGSMQIVVRHNRIMESGTFTKLQLCRQSLDDLMGRVAAYEQAIREVSGTGSGRKGS